uniref:Uncharacterized protein n=1 Tax=Anguilla anguilla TaxID=7936 RepID=A0A0E9W7R7_ANGAN
MSHHGLIKVVTQILVTIIINSWLWCSYFLRF